jgi:hypothetical protein
MLHRCTPAIFVSATFYLPNRAYYTTLKTLTQDQLTETVGHVLQYAALELLSLVVVGVVLDRLLGFSTVQLLAFTLRKHAPLAQELCCCGYRWQHNSHLSISVRPCKERVIGGIVC